MSNSKKLLHHWLKQGQIAPNQLDKAFELAEINPQSAQWQHFFNYWLLVNGSILTAAGVIFFVAFNWQDLGRWFKFGLLELLVIIPVLAWHFLAPKPTGKVALTGAAVMVGALLAFFGQTYQTGADTWQLFASWAVAILPWALLGQSAALWLLWVVLINVASWLYYQIFHGWLGWFWDPRQMQLVNFLFNAGVLMVWEFSRRYCVWLQPRIEPRLLALSTGAMISLLMIEWIFSASEMPYALPLWLAWLLIGFFYYRYLLRDVFMLAVGCLSLIVVVTVLFMKVFFAHDGLGAFFLTSVWLIGSATIAVRWLRQLAVEADHV